MDRLGSSTVYVYITVCFDINGETPSESWVGHGIARGNMLLCDNYENKKLSSTENVHTPHTLDSHYTKVKMCYFVSEHFYIVRDETEQDYVEANENLIG